jgi:Spy/CpxP family protein refolding chaperone
MKSKLGIALSWIVVFLLGAVAGSVCHYIYQQRVKPPAFRPMTPTKPGSIVEGMARELKLDDQQKEQLKSIFEQGRQRYLSIGQQYRTARNETNEQIKQILRPDQRAKYEEFLKKAYTRPPGRRPPQPSPQKQQ